MNEHAKSIAGAMKCLDDFMTAFNAGDVEAWEATLNYPSARIASNKLAIIDKPGWHPRDMFEKGLGVGWARSGWERRDVIHAGPDKVHFDTCFVRYRADGSVIGHYDSIYVVTLQDGHWGVKARSSFAP